MSRDEIEKTGLRILNLFRALTARQMNEKDLRNKHDLMPDWIFDYPEDKQPFTPGHDKMDRADMEMGKDLLYEELGWDKATGVPTRQTLTDLGLADVADQLQKLGLLA